jgi:hypothetical protein
MKQQSTHALAAKMIRKELKKAYPNTTFTVRARSFSGGDSVDIEWTDGPTDKQVADITAKYQYGHFDGIQDLYENTNRRIDIPQVRFVHERRKYSDQALQKEFRVCKEKFGGWENITSLDEEGNMLDFFSNYRYWTPRAYIIDRVLRDKSLS